MGAWCGGGGIPACTEGRPPPKRRLLLRMLRILLECILVCTCISVMLCTNQLHKNTKSKFQSTVKTGKWKLMETLEEVIYNKIAFQYDAYRPLVDRISQHALLLGGSAPGGVRSWGGLLLGGSAPGGVCSGGWYPNMH